MSSLPESSLQGDEDRTSFGERVRRLRKEKGWTLADLSARTGLALSTISKVERGQMSLTYDRIIRLAHGLEVDIGELFSAQRASVSAGAMCITRKGEAQSHATDYYIYDMLCTEIRDKQMTPILGHIRAHNIKDFDSLISHDGEEFLYVLSGGITVHSADHLPMKLKRGDSIYFDSSMGHAYVSTGKNDALVLVVCWHSPTTGKSEEATMKIIEERRAQDGNTGQSE